MPHRIRLRPPWHHHRQTDASIWRRHFNRPTGLGPTDRVYVVLEGSFGPGTIALNGQPLGQLHEETTLQAFEVTGRLLPSNELNLRLEPAAPLAQPVLPGVVRLEIHSPADE